jgi:alkylation response protein AidB-like acyl-CoA dehydrogenase
MNFALSDEQKMLREGAERYLAENYGFEQRRRLIEGEHSFSMTQWRQFAEMGWLALPLPEDCDGLGGTFVDITLIQEALGGRLVLEPYAATVILCAYLLDGATDAGVRGTTLRRIASGELRVALAHAENDLRYDLAGVGMRASRSDHAYRLTGRKITVWDAGSAQQLIVSAVIEGDDTLSLFLVDRRGPGLTAHDYPLIDSTHAADFEFESVPATLLIPRDRAMSRLEHAMDRMTLAQVAEALGIMEKVLEITAEQLRNRSQFGQPLAKFQALQHRMAEMFVEVQETRSILYRGISMIDAPPQDRSLAVSVAKVVAMAAAGVVGGQGIQLHGGVGMTDEYAVGHYFKRLLALEKQYGDADHHLRRIAKTYRHAGVSRG